MATLFLEVGEMHFLHPSSLSSETMHSLCTRRFFQAFNTGPSVSSCLSLQSRSLPFSEYLELRGPHQINANTQHCVNGVFRCQWCLLVQYRLGLKFGKLGHFL